MLSWERRPLKRRKNSSTGEMGFQRNLIRSLREICPPLGPEAGDMGHSSVTLWLVVKIIALRMDGPEMLLQKKVRFCMNDVYIIKIKHFVLFLHFFIDLSMEDST